MIHKFIFMFLFASLIGFIFMDIPWARETASPSMLSGTCFGCHGPNGISKGNAIPTISGMPEKYIIGAMLAYKYDNNQEKIDEIIKNDSDFTGVIYFARPSNVMNRITKGYSEEEIKIIASYFANQEFKTKE